MTKNNNNTKILLVSDNKSDIENIKMRLEESINFPCYIWHCFTLSEALDYLDKKKLRADIVILDLGLTGTISPQEIYKKMGKAAQNIPIVVMTGTGKEEHDIAVFVMEAGASDHMVRGEFSRIAEAIEFVLIRHRIAAKTSDESSKNIESLQTDHDDETLKAKTRSDKKNHEKNQYISWVMGGYSVEENLKKQ